MKYITQQGYSFVYEAGAKRLARVEVAKLKKTGGSKEDIAKAKAGTLTQAQRQRGAPGGTSPEWHDDEISQYHPSEPAIVARRQALAAKPEDILAQKKPGSVGHPLLVKKHASLLQKRDDKIRQSATDSAGLPTREAPAPPAPPAPQRPVARSTRASRGAAKFAATQSRRGEEAEKKRKAEWEEHNYGPRNDESLGSAFKGIVSKIRQKFSLGEAKSAVERAAAVSGRQGWRMGLGSNTMLRTRRGPGVEELGVEAGKLRTRRLARQTSLKSPIGRILRSKPVQATLGGYMAPRAPGLGSQKGPRDT